MWGKRELIALLNLTSWCLVMVERLFLAVPWGCLQFVIVVFPDHTHYFCLNNGQRPHIMPIPGSANDWHLLKHLTKTPVSDQHVILSEN